MNKAFSNFTWYNKPDTRSPLAALYLNLINSALNTVDDRVVAMDTSKANQSDLLDSLKSVSYDGTTGVWVFEKWDGTSQTFDQNIEKIPVAFSMNDKGIITMTNADGTSYTTDIGKLIKPYSFLDSDTIDFTSTSVYSSTPYIVYFNGAVNNATLSLTSLEDSAPDILTVSSSDSDLPNITTIVLTYDTATATNLSKSFDINDTSAVINFAKDISTLTNLKSITVNFDSAPGKTYRVGGHRFTQIRVTAIIPDGAITGEKLQPNYLADVTEQANLASTSASSASSSANDADYDRKLAQSYSVGGSGVREGEDTDNAKYYKEQAAAIVGDKGHTIQNSANEIMQSRNILQFLNCTLTDDETNDRIKISPDFVITDSQWTSIETILA